MIKTVITDEMCLKAIKARSSSRHVQGFVDDKECVIRDTRKPNGEQVVWRGKTKDRAAFERQHEIEQMRAFLDVVFNGDK